MREDVWENVEWTLSNQALYNALTEPPVVTEKSMPIRHGIEIFIQENDAPIRFISYRLVLNKGRISYHICRRIHEKGKFQSQKDENYYPN